MRRTGSLCAETETWLGFLKLWYGFVDLPNVSFCSRVYVQRGTHSSNGKILDRQREGVEAYSHPHRCDGRTTVYESDEERSNELANEINTTHAGIHL